MAWWSTRRLTTLAATTLLRWMVPGGPSGLEQICITRLGGAESVTRRALRSLSQAIQPRGNAIDTPGATVTRATCDAWCAALFASTWLVVNAAASNDAPRRTNRL